MYRLNLVTFLLISSLIAGCATPARQTTRQFDFATDTFSYANELVWDYSYTPDGQWTTKTRDPKPTYYQHCFVMARSALQFYENARFTPELPKVSDATY